MFSETHFRTLVRWQMRTVVTPTATLETSALLSGCTGSLSRCDKESGFIKVSASERDAESPAFPRGLWLFELLERIPGSSDRRRRPAAAGGVANAVYPSPSVSLGNSFILKLRTRRVPA